MFVNKTFVENYTYFKNVNAVENLNPQHLYHIYPLYNTFPSFPVEEDIKEHLQDSDLLDLITDMLFQESLIIQPYIQPRREILQLCELRRKCHHTVIKIMGLDFIDFAQNLALELRDYGCLSQLKLL